MEKLPEIGIKGLYASEIGQTWLIHSERCQSCIKGDFCADSMTILDEIGQTRI